ncbi:unnamed protein product [Pocillopora meandrina]|uniref:Uncharacterized protein n=1 Tax=Pocillopora meandrina TaxID=46732 RepID=A0AAU9VN72_9CNID|nr:unnamed protein product [Pocillopora meandrina]
MGGIDCTDQLLKPYELSMFNRFIVYQKGGHQKQFLRFQHKVIAALL